jgi:hypothetical protein
VPTMHNHDVLQLATQAIIPNSPTPPTTSPINSSAASLNTSAAVNANPSSPTTAVSVQTIFTPEFAYQEIEKLTREAKAANPNLTDEEILKLLASQKKLTIVMIPLELTDLADILFASNNRLEENLQFYQKITKYAFTENYYLIRSGRSAIPLLHFAVIYENTDTVRHLVNLPQTNNATSSEKTLILRQQITRFLSEPAQIPENPRYNNLIPLHIAIQQGSNEIAVILIQAMAARGINLNAPATGQQNQVTPLQLAITCGNMEIVGCLLNELTKNCKNMDEKIALIIDLDEKQDLLTSAGEHLNLETYLFQILYPEITRHTPIIYPIPDVKSKQFKTDRRFNIKDRTDTNTTDTKNNNDTIIDKIKGKSQPKATAKNTETSNAIKLANTLALQNLKKISEGNTSRFSNTNNKLYLISSDGTKELLELPDNNENEAFLAEVMIISLNNEYLLVSPPYHNLPLVCFAVIRGNADTVQNLCFPTFANTKEKNTQNKARIQHIRQQLGQTASFTIASKINGKITESSIAHATSLHLAVHIKNLKILQILLNFLQNYNELINYIFNTKATIILDTKATITEKQKPPELNLLQLAVSVNQLAILECLLGFLTKNCQKPKQKIAKLCEIIRQDNLLETAENYNLAEIIEYLQNILKKNKQQTSPTPTKPSNSSSTSSSSSTLATSEPNLLESLKKAINRNDSITLQTTLANTADDTIKMQALIYITSLNISIANPKKTQELWHIFDIILLSMFHGQATDENYWSLIPTAIAGNNSSLLEYLITKTQIPNKIDGNCNTLLHLIMHRTPKYAKSTLRKLLTLLHGKININAKNIKNQTPLALAMESCNIPAAVILLSNGARIRDCNIKLEQTNAQVKTWITQLLITALELFQKNFYLGEVSASTNDDGTFNITISIDPNNPSEFLTEISKKCQQQNMAPPLQNSHKFLEYFKKFFAIKPRQCKQDLHNKTHFLMQISLEDADKIIEKSTKFNREAFAQQYIGKKPKIGPTKISATDTSSSENETPTTITKKVAFPPNTTIAWKPIFFSTPVTKDQHIKNICKKVLDLLKKLNFNDNPQFDNEEKTKIEKRLSQILTISNNPNQATDDEIKDLINFAGALFFQESPDTEPSSQNASDENNLKMALNIKSEHESPCQQK